MFPLIITKKFNSEETLLYDFACQNITHKSSENLKIIVSWKRKQ